MNKTPLTADSLDIHIACVNRLKPDTVPIFGTLDARGVVRHLRFTHESSIGEPEATDESKPVLRTIFWILFFNVFTNWPGGKIKGPPSATPDAEFDFDEERRLLVDVMRSFAEKLEKDPDERHVNPGLGPISVKKWSHLHGIHNHHHFRQFQLLD